MSVLAGGNAIAQLAALAAAPVLTRLYTPTDFGILAIYMSITSIVSVVICLRFEMAIPLPEKTEDAIAATWLSLFCTLALTIAGFLLIYIYRTDFNSLLKLEKNSNISLMLPVSFFLIGLFKAYSFWSIREKIFAVVSKARIYQVLSSIGTQLLLFPLGSLGLIFGQIANNGCGVGMVRKTFTREPEHAKINISACLQIARTYWRLPAIGMWASLINISSSKLPVLLFAALFSPAMAGFYALAAKVVNIPSNVIANAIRKVFLTTAADAHRSNTLSEQFSLVLDKSVRSIAPWIVILSIYLPEIFEIFFGKGWATAGEFSRYLVIVCFCQLAVSPLMAIYTILGEQVVETLQHSFRFGIRLLAILIGYKYSNEILAIALYSIATAISYIVFIIWAHKTLNITFFKLWKTVLRMTFSCILIYFVFLLANIIIGNLWIALLLTIIVASTQTLTTLRN